MVARKVAFRRDWKKLFAQRDDFKQWFEHNSYLLDSPAMLLGDEMHTVHFDWDQAAKDGTLNDHFKIALVEVNPSPFASCTAVAELGLVLAQSALRGSLDGPPGAAGSTSTDTRSPSAPA